MTSVSAVASADIRQNLSIQPSNSGEDPFALLLDAATGINVGVAQDAPPLERRDDVPPQQAKPETDGRPAKRRASQSDQPEKPKPEAAAPKEVAADDASGETEETETTEDDGDETLVEALLTLALGDTLPQTAPSPTAALNVEANVTAQTPAATAATQVAASAEIQPLAAPSLALAVADAAEVPENQIAQVAPLAAGIKTNAAAEIENAASVTTDVELEAAPKIPVEGLGRLLKPLRTLPAAAEALDARPVTIKATASIPSRALAHLETLNAALSKHFQFAAAVETDAPLPEGQKPVFPGNGFLPNLALSIQPTATVSAPQAAAETARTVPLESLAVEIATRAKNGERRFDIRLDPPELGRIDVRLEIDHKGNTSTKLIVERAETLDMLQRDARGLEKALQSAGLKTDAGGLEFSLRQDAPTQQNQPNGSQAPHRQELVQAEEEVSAQIALGNATLAAQLRGGVDIRI